MKRSLHIIMPMAGEGSRFVNAGYTTPKPLIVLNDKPLFIRSIDSIAQHLDSDINVKYTFIVRQEHIDEYHIDDSIKEYIPTANIVSVDKTTRGAVETCMLAKHLINDNDSVVVMDCDLEFYSESFINNICVLSNFNNPKCGGMIVSFNSNLPKYSYAEIDKHGFVVRTAEKEVISDNALCGAYFFSTGKRFKEISDQLLNEPDFKKPEYYVSLLYNYLIENGEYVLFSKVNYYKSYGTPEELNQYL